MLDSRRRVLVGTPGTKPQTHVFWLGPPAPLGARGKTQLKSRFWRHAERGERYYHLQGRKKKKILRNEKDDDRNPVGFHSLDKRLFH